LIRKLKADPLRAGDARERKLLTLRLLGAMAVDLVYETHSISVDNERGIATGWLPGELSAEGRHLAYALGERRRNDGIDCVFTSDLRRALQTAEIVVESLRSKQRLQLTEHLAPSTPTAKQIAWLKSLRPAPGSVLLVGHEPNFSELTSRLLTGQKSLAINFKKAGLCKVTAARLGSGNATLEWLLTPKQMELMQ